MNGNQGSPHTVDLSKSLERAELKLGLRYRGYKMVRVLRADTYPNNSHCEVSAAHELIETVRMQEIERAYTDVRENGCTMSVNRAFKVWRTYLVFGVPKDKAFDELQKKLEVAEVQCNTVTRLHAEQESTLEKVKRELADFKSTAGARKLAQDAAVQAMQDAQGLTARMEKDIAKIRKEIGEARYKEIVGA